MSPSVDIQAQLSKAIIADDEDNQFGPILDALINGTITSRIAASDILDNLALEDDLDSATYALSTHLQNLALEYPFLLPHLTSLMTNVLDLPSSAPQQSFLTSFTYNLGDLSRSLYGSFRGSAS